MEFWITWLNIRKTSKPKEPFVGLTVKTNPKPNRKKSTPDIC